MSLITRAQSCAEDAVTAVDEFARGIFQPDLAVVLFFCSSQYDLGLLSQAINQRFPGVKVIGCTAAGTYGAQGFHVHSLSGVGFSRSVCVAEVCCFEHLQTFDAAAAQLKVQQLRQSLEAQAPWVQSVNTIAVQLIDGLSVREETVTRTIQNALGAVFMTGGSAADDLTFKKTWVFFDGAFHADAAVLALISTRLPFYQFMTQHFSPLDERMVVTRADTERRIVYEINALPAAEEYARCAGVKQGLPDPALFFSMPVVVKVGNHHYVRAIQQVLPDGALRFYCAIEEGMVLRLASGGDLVGSLEEVFSAIENKIGPPLLVLGSDCVLRRQEIEQHHLNGEVDRLCTGYRLVGFASFGEQYRGVHLNQTFSGIAFGQTAGADDDDRR
jgi:hypothetical protein